MFFDNLVILKLSAVVEVYLVEHLLDTYQPVNSNHYKLGKFKEIWLNEKALLWLQQQILAHLGLMLILNVLSSFLQCLHWLQPVSVMRKSLTPAFNKYLFY